MVKTCLQLTDENLQFTGGCMVEQVGEEEGKRASVTMIGDSGKQIK